MSVIGCRFLCLALLPLRLGAQEQQNACALLETLHKPVYWKASSRASPKALDPDLDSEKILHSGESIRCGPGGGAVVWAGGKEVALSEKDHEFPILCGESQRSATADDIAASAQEILQRYGRRAGRQRAISSIIFMPAEGSSIQARDFAVRWIPPPDAAKVSIILETTRGSVLWQQADVNASYGSLNSDAAKRILADYAQRPLRSDLLLELAFTSGERAGTHFSVLSPDREESLARDLESMQQGLAGVLAHIARSAIFDSYGMYNNAAGEYEEALRQAPRSRDLLLAALDAEQRIGNLTRVEQLQQLLAKEGLDRQQ